MRAANIAGVSAATGTAAWAMIGRASSSGVRKYTVQPEMLTPAIARLRRCGVASLSKRRPRPATAVVARG